MRRYGHNIELAYNHQWIICNEMEEGEREFKKEAFELFEKISDTYCSAKANTDANGIAWVNGKTYGLLKELSVWADAYRDGRIKR